MDQVDSYNTLKGNGILESPYPDGPTIYIGERMAVQFGKIHDLLDHPTLERNYTEGDARRFAQTLAKGLGFSTTYVQPAYEDVYYMLWEAGQVPVDEDPMKAGKDASIERQTVAEQLRKGLDRPKGFVMPLKWNYQYQDWET